MLFPRRIIFYVKLWPIASHRPSTMPNFTRPNAGGGRWLTACATLLVPSRQKLAWMMFWIASWANWSMICMRCSSHLAAGYEQLYLAHIRGREADVDDALHRWPESYGFLAAASIQNNSYSQAGRSIGPTGAARGFSADYSSIAAALRAGDRPLGVLTLTHHARTVWTRGPGDNLHFRKLRLGSYRKRRCTMLRRSRPMLGGTLANRPGSCQLEESG